jgi:nitrogen regulatory protein P-II 1
MTPSHRIEIVIEEPIAPELIRLLKQLHVPGYTVIPRASGGGDRGIRRGDELAGDSSNCLFIIACDDKDLVDRLTEAVKPLLSRSGGVCLVSECLMLTH